MNAIEIVNLSKTYGKIRALNNMNLEVPEGAIYGLVGPNGSGKTTLIKTLIGSARPGAGYALVLGLSPIKDKWQLRRQIGYMPQSPALYDDLSARENILFFGKAQRVANLHQKTAELLSFTGLANRADDLVRTFSGGMKKRVSLCCALVHKPRILLLDEPTAAVDPQLKQMMWLMFKKLAGSGITIFISTHQMDEALLCDKVTIIRNGEIVAVDTPQNILQRGKTQLKVVVDGQENVSEIGSTTKDLAEELRKFGLHANVYSIELHSENIEEIVLSIIQEKEE